MRILKGITVFLLLFFSFVVFNNKDAVGDLQVQKEVVIAPKSGRAGANIGPVNHSAAISMVKADVSIRPGPLPSPADEKLALHISAAFVMKNESSDTVLLTVGFPVSDSSYSSFVLEEFHATSNGEIRSVFNRVSRYPRNIQHVHISGPDPQGYRDLPDYYDPNVPSDSDDPGRIFGIQKIGSEPFQNLMVWKEIFDPFQARRIQVAYRIAVPLQKNSIIRKKELGNYKGIWPQEANNMPLPFLSKLPEGELFYFFDYYLKSGASWKGVVGEQTVDLILDPTWSGHILYRYIGIGVSEIQKEGEMKIYSFSLRGAEPSANLLFALKRP